VLGAVSAKFTWNGSKSEVPLKFCWKVGSAVLKQ